MSQTRATLSSTAQSLRSKDYESEATHPFASGSGQLIQDLQSVINATSSISHSLDTFISMTAFTNPKVVSELRQHAMISHNLHTLEHQSHSITSGLKGERLSLTRFGEDVPRDQAVLPAWCISKIEGWGTAVGLQHFTEWQPSGKITLPLAGKLVVLDIVFQKEGDKLDAISVSISYAMPTHTESAHPLLDELILRHLKQFLSTVQGDADPWETARLGGIIQGHLRDLFILDNLVSEQDTDNGEPRWFDCVKSVNNISQKLAETEARTIALSLGHTTAPVDIYLMRAHGLPLPYLSSLSMSFLVHLSPKAYLHLKRLAEGHHDIWDIPLSVVRDFLMSKPRPAGACVADLKLVKRAGPVVPYNQGAKRPVLPPDASTDYEFPQSNEFSWVLDLTANSGSHKGVIMTQSRMREIGSLVHTSELGGINSVPFGRSWLHALFGSQSLSEYYISTYTSPSSIHPSLHLRLQVPPEPGFVLQQIPVRSMKQVWGVLEVIREQCWLNETLLTCNWKPELEATFSQGMQEQPSSQETDESTEQELQALLSGNFTPQEIPVNVELPISENNLDSSKPNGIPRIVMSVPTPSRTSAYVNMVNIPVSFKANSRCGVEIDLSMLTGLSTEGYGEVCRRGGCFSLPGRVWAGMNSYG